MSYFQIINNKIDYKKNLGKNDLYIKYKKQYFHNISSYKNLKYNQKCNK